MNILSAINGWRINFLFNRAANGPNGRKFNLAYRALISLDSKNPADCAIVKLIAWSIWPVRALFIWFDARSMMDDSGHERAIVGGVPDSVTIAPSDGSDVAVTESGLSAGNKPS